MGITTNGAMASNPAAHSTTMKAKNRTPKAMPIRIQRPPASSRWRSAARVAVPAGIRRAPGPFPVPLM